ncbi:MAG: transglycosylase SLT domain-containing protein [Spirochaetota bacterium]
MQSEKKSVFLTRKKAARLVIAASFCIASFFLISSSATLFDSSIFASTKNKNSSIMFAVTLKNNGSYSDPVSRLYINDKTKNQVLKFFSAITNSMPVAKAILDNSIAHNVRPSLAFAVAYVESRYNPKARSVNTSGSLNSGLFQLNSSVFDKISEKQVFDPYHNARIGISHLKEYLILSEDEFTALAAYNAGITRIAEQGIPGVTFKYISEVSIMERKIMDLFVASMVLSGNPL